MAIERNTTYRLEWEDWQGAACRLDIVDSETVRKDVVQLTPGATPFKTERDDDESPLAPLRDGTGTISVVGNHETLAKLEVTSGCRYRVRLTRGGAVAWCGWLTGDVISQSYATAPDEFSLQCIDDVGALDLWKMTQQDFAKDGNEYTGNMNPVRISDVLAECFCHVNGAYAEPSSGAKDTLTFVFPVECGTDLWQLKSCVRRLAFFTDKDTENEEDEDTSGAFLEADSCRTALEKICTATGWSCSAQGLKIVFTSPRGSGSNVELTFAELYAGTIPESSAAVGTLAPTPLGAHEISRYRGLHKGCVRAEVETFSDLIPDLDDVGSFAKDCGTQTWGASSLTTKSFRAISYRCKNRLALLSYMMDLKSTVTDPKSVDDYDITPVTGLRPWDWNTIYRTNSETHGSVYSGLAKFDAFVADESKTNYNFTTGLMATCWYACSANSIYRYIHYTPTVPLAVLRGYSVALLSGFLVFNAKITNYRFVPKIDSWTTKSLPVAIRVGNKYWDNTEQTWVAAKKVNYLPLDKTSGAAVNDTKTLEMACSGASGLIIPITEELCGEVELSFYSAPDYGYAKNIAGDLMHLPYLYYAITDVSLKFQNEDAVDFKDLPGHYNYTQYTDGWQADSEVVSVYLHSTRDGQSGRGQLLTLSDGSYLPLEKVNDKRPEEWLLAKVAGFFLRPRRMVKITAQYDGTATPGDVYTDADGGVWSLLGVTETDWLTGQSVLYMVDIPTATEN